MKIIYEELENQLRLILNEISIPQFNEILLGIKSGVDISVYADTKYGWEQMGEIRIGLEHGIDATVYADPKYDWEQMREIRLELACE